MVVFHGMESLGTFAEHTDSRSLHRPTNQDAFASVARESEATFDLNTYLVDRNAFYQSLPARYVQNKRLEDQANLLEAYKKDPERVSQKIHGAPTVFLFDAVIDAKNMVRVGTFG